MNRPLDLQKKELRKILKEKRNALDPDTCRSSDTAIFKAITSWDVYQKAETVFCFVGTEDEINTRPVLEDLLKRGKQVGVPKCISKGIMEVYKIRSFDDLEPGKYGILEPKEGCEKISPKAIHLALIPCLSCRTALMCDEIPMEAHDRTIDFVICEAGVLNTKNNA